MCMPSEGEEEAIHTNLDLALSRKEKLWTGWRWNCSGERDCGACFIHSGPRSRTGIATVCYVVCKNPQWRYDPLEDSVRMGRISRGCGGLVRRATRRGLGLEKVWNLEA